MNRKHYILITAALLIISACAVAYTALYKSGRISFQAQHTLTPPVTDEAAVHMVNSLVTVDEQETAAVVLADIRVYVIGAVVAPDVYTFSEGAIVKDAITAAGGATDEADLEAINLAEKIVDGQKLRIPKLGEAVAEAMESMEASTAVQSPGYASDGRININTAPLSLLITLDGIGESIGNGIIAYREKYGSFQTIEEIKNVSRIGEKTFEGIQDFICVE